MSVGSSTPSVYQPQINNAREIIQDARDEAFKIKKAAEDEASKTRQEALDIEKRIAQKEESLDIKLTRIARAEKQLEEKSHALLKKEEELVKTRNELIEKLSKVSSLTAEETKSFVNTLLGPAKPNAALKKAAKRYNAFMKKDD